MADYSKTTNFTAKDALASGDPNKVIKGSEHNTEYDNISTSVATKADKVTSATDHNLLMMDVNGNLEDSTIVTDGAGTLTATLTGNASTATTADAWTTGRTITLTGDVTGASGAFDGSGNLSFATTVVDAGAGNKVLLQSQTASNDATIDFVNGTGGAVIDTTYDMYEIELINVLPATDDAELQARISNDTGSTWESTGYVNSAGGVTTSMEFTSQAAGSGVSNVAAEGGASGALGMINPGAAGVRTFVSSNKLVYMQGGGLPSSMSTLVNGAYDTAEADDGVQFFFSSGNITSGTFNLYGISK